MTFPGKVAVAMSGGVDSSVAAALLVDQGEDVFGVMMRLWVEDGRVNRCCSPADARRQKRRQPGIPFYVLDMREPLMSEAAAVFLDGYARAHAQPLHRMQSPHPLDAAAVDAMSLGASPWQRPLCTGG
jgi:tRNA U34 2-thiouridine synthase MnmA/TrmU